MRPALRIRAALLDRLLDLALGAHDDDGDRRVREAVSVAGSAVFLSVLHIKREKRAA
jgi:hypothetical protein